MAHQAAPDANTRLFAPGFAGHSQISARTLGFWLYMLSDALLFTALFAAYAVLDTPMNAAGGPIASQIVNPVEGFWQTIAILGSVTAYSLATVALKTGNRAGVMLGIVAAMVLAVVFLGFGFNDLATLTAQGNGMDRSGYLSAYFVLILTHAIHMLFGLIWMLVMLVQIPRDGFNEMVVARLLNLRMFWQFQATVWVCVYIYVYMIGA
ncbi:cytochrome c oxidase subunit 3 [Acidocella facilis]|uniref:cytochrome c oxidase subunit 3 n=1 Tax=Acidocella facilis TaxID=525 RepID=UPI00047CF499|nr:cytochrome c oxidase subunit 3 [Acidocella facilis]